MSWLFPAPSLAKSFALSAGLQLAAWAFSTVGRAEPTEHYYDLSGSLTHLALAAAAVGGAASARGGGGPGARVALLGALSAVWAARLGAYLAARVSRLGKDERFDKLKRSPATWAIPWAAQAVWCCVVQAPLTLAAAAAARGGGAARLTRGDALGVALFVGGLALEVAADAHKDAAKRRAPAAPVTTGPFAFCVYPAYFGECGLWWGAVALAAPALAGRPWELAAACASPLFTALLLWRVSGIPLLEASSWKKYGADEAWLHYRARTSLFFPWPPAAVAAPDDLARARARGAAAQRKLA